MGMNVNIIGVKTTNTEQVKQAISKYELDNQKKIPHILVSDLTFNIGWTALIVEYDQFMFKVVEALSNNLQTTVIDFERYDTPGTQKVLMYKNGQLEDEFDILDHFDVNDAMGFFEQYNNIEFDSYEDVSNIFSKYFKKVGFEPLAAEILDKVK